MVFVHSIVTQAGQVQSLRAPIFRLGSGLVTLVIHHNLTSSGAVFLLFPRTAVCLFFLEVHPPTPIVTWDEDGPVLIALGGDVHRSGNSDIGFCLPL